MENLKIEYKGFNITFVEYNDSWDCGEYQNISLKKVKTWIDKIVKTKFKKFDVYFEAWGYQDKTTTVTVTAKSEGEDCYWISNKGKRSKETSNRLFKITPENTKLFKEIIECTAQEANLRTQKNKLADQLESIKERLI